MTASTNNQSIEAGFLRKTKRLSLISRLIILFERTWPAIWPGFSVLGFFIALSLFDPWGSTPPFIHAIILISTVIASYILLRKGLKSIRYPTKKEGLRRLEKPASLKNRPLDFLEDEPVENSSDESKTIWSHHNLQLQSDIQKIKVSTPNAGLQNIDPQGVRMILLLVFIVGAFHAGNDWARRIGDSFTISFSSRTANLSLNVWVTPPEYTNKPPISLVNFGQVNNEVSIENLIIPYGSTIDINLNGSNNSPDVSLNSNELVFSEKSENNYSTHETIFESGFLEIDIPFKKTLAWNIEVIPDTPPTIHFAETPKQTNRNTLEVSSISSDDYGIETAFLSIHQPGDIKNPALSLPISLRANQSEETLQKSYFDLTSNRWAGSLILAKLFAEDAITQRYESEELQFRLPEKEFTHPVAQNIVNIRKSIFLNPNNKGPIRQRLDLQSKNQDQFNHDLVVFSALRASYWRMNWAEKPEDLDTITTLLWDTALRLEDGNLSLSENELRATMDELMEMLENGDPNQETEKLTDQLEQLLSEYLENQTGAQQSTEQMNPDGSEQSQPPQNNELMDMMKQIQELAAAGQTEEAMEMMEKLREVMENASQEGPTPEDYEQMMEGTKSLNELDNLRQDQNDLMKSTNQEGLLEEANKDQEKGPREEVVDELAKKQKDLNERLQELMDKLNKDGFEESEQLKPAKSSLDEAQKNLEQQTPSEAAQNQSSALDSMDETLSSLGQKLAEQMVEMQENSQNQDPMGRPISPQGTEEVVIPDQQSFQDAQKILQELRRRLSDPSRPQAEIEYLRRLLKRFK